MEEGERYIYIYVKGFKGREERKKERGEKKAIRKQKLWKKMRKLTET